jgi:putative membrane protein
VPEVTSGWTFEPLVLIASVTGAWVYGRGAAAIRSRRGGPRYLGMMRITSFSSGVLVLWVALLSPIHALGHSLLSVHMVQHLLLVLVAPPLLILGRPTLAALEGTPKRLRRWLIGLRMRRSVRSASRAMSRPPLALAAHLGVLYIWHTPAAYEAAVRSSAMHMLEHVTFLGTALLFWSAVMRYGSRSGSSVLYVFAAMLLSMPIGALMIFSNVVWYHVYAAPAQALGTNALLDQQVAGAIMWAPGGVVYLIAATALFVGWLHHLERRSRQRDKRLGAIGPTSAGLGTRL